MSIFLQVTEEKKGKVVNSSPIEKLYGIPFISDIKASGNKSIITLSGVNGEEERTVSESKTALDLLVKKGYVDFLLSVTVKRSSDNLSNTSIFKLSLRASQIIEIFKYTQNLSDSIIRFKEDPNKEILYTVDESFDTIKGLIPDGDSDTLEDKPGAFYLNRTNHTGTQLSSTISDFEAQLVNVKNSKDILYIKGDDTTDQSIRIKFDEGDSIAHIEKRADGVWNDTGFRFSAGSIELGRDLLVGSAASFIETFNEAIADGHQRALIPHIPFNTTGTQQLHTPVLDNLRVDTVYGPAVSETTGTSAGISFFTNHARFVNIISHEVGNTGATTPIEYSVYSGTDSNGVLITRQNLPVSSFVANTTANITFPSDIGFNNATNFFIELKSDSLFSLKTDVSGNPLTKFTEQHLEILGIVTENLVYNNDLDHVLDNSLNPVYSNQF